MLVTSLIVNMKSLELDNICITTEKFEIIYREELQRERISDLFLEKKIFQKENDYELINIDWNNESIKIFRYQIIRNSEKKEKPVSNLNNEKNDKKKYLDELIKIYQLSTTENSIEIEFCLYDKDYLYFVQKEYIKNLFDDDQRKKFTEFNETERLWSYRELANTLKILKNNGFLHKDIHPLKIKLYKDTEKIQNIPKFSPMSEIQIEDNTTSPIKLEVINNLEKINTLYSPKHILISAPEINENKKNILTEKGSVFSFALTLILIEIGIEEFEKILGDEFSIIMNDKGIKKKHEAVYNIVGQLLFKKNYFEHSYFSPGIFKGIKNWFLSFFIDNSMERIYNVNDLLLKALSYEENDRLTFEDIVNKMDLFMQNLPDYRYYKDVIKKREINEIENLNFERLRQINII